jgi:UDP-N-acetylglucosamine 2-epimerase (non-hydrolysing)
MTDKSINKTKIFFCAGTAGELIKLYPLFARLDGQNIEWWFLFTGQSPVNFRKQWDDFGLPKDKIVTLFDSLNDLRTSAQALRWFFKAARLTKRNLVERILPVVGAAPSSNDVIIIHGDTLSTLIGAVVGKRTGFGRIAHVEAGLRSPQIFKPFPEEITRRIVSRIANLHFPQDKVAQQNLERARVSGEIICTGTNTLFDAIIDVDRNFPNTKIPEQPYVVANLHRFENLNSNVRWPAMLDTLCLAAKKYKIYFVQHPPAAEKIASDSAAAKKLIDAGVVLLPRQPFTSFIRMIHGAYFVISDGGSNQEECAYLGKPCLILRDSSERVEGLNGGSCLLTKFDNSLINQFLENPDLYLRPALNRGDSPTTIIVNRILEPY